MIKTYLTTIILLLFIATSCSTQEDFNYNKVDNNKFDNNINHIQDASTASDIKENFNTSILNALNQSKRITTMLHKFDVIYEFNSKHFEIEKTLKNLKEFNDLCDVGKVEIEGINYFFENDWERTKILNVIVDAKYDCNQFTFKFDYYITSTEHLLFRYVPYPYHFDNDMMRLIREKPNNFILN